MKKALFLAIWMGTAPAMSWAVVKDRPIRYRQTIIDDGRRRTESRSGRYAFNMNIVSDTEGIKPETRRGSASHITATEGERYAIQLTNPLPVRVAVNLTVDGLNSISGKPVGIKDGEKWMIEPHGTITIRGWQVNAADARRFFFTSKNDSYAKWRGSSWGKDLSVNCGVIGAAFFWNRAELQAYHDANPVVVHRRKPSPYAGGDAMRSMSEMPAADCEEAKPLGKKETRRAGTGMGERETHLTRQVEFHYDEGMDTLAEALVLYYDFAPENAPHPFPEMSFAPEMP